MFNFEHKREPLMPVGQFYRRVFRNFMWALLVLFSSLAIGVIGYMELAHLRVADAVLNSCMILGGMGPVDALPTDAAKYFASVYALFSGITFLSTVALLLAPAIHRIMHKFHLETEEEAERNDDQSLASK